MHAKTIESLEWGKNLDYSLSYSSNSTYYLSAAACCSFIKYGKQHNKKMEISQSSHFCATVTACDSFALCIALGGHPVFFVIALFRLCVSLKHCFFFANIFLMRMCELEKVKAWIHFERNGPLKILPLN